MDWTAIAKELPSWLLYGIAVVFLIEKMGLLRRQGRRTDVAEGPIFEALGQSASTAHDQLRRADEIIQRLNKENDDFREANLEYRRENLMLVDRLERSDASRKRLLKILDTINKEQNDLIDAGVLERKLQDGITQIRTDFENTRIGPPGGR
jgi:hypothetical protein